MIELLPLLSIPLSSALVGWGTNVLALKMTFYPVEFVGLKPPYLGWQGIIPAKAVSMAERTVDLITTRLVGLEEVIGRLDPDAIADLLAVQFQEVLRDIIDDVMKAERPELWRLLPDSVKDQVYDRAITEAPEVIRQSVIDLKIEVEDVLDLKAMAVGALLEDRAFLNQIFLECGKHEFKFIERSGFYFGFMFGLIVMVLWLVFQSPFIMPVVGFLIGWLTNFLALKMIFEPQQPKKILKWTWQGSFLKRQVEVSEAYSRLIARNIVSTQNILRTLFEGPGADRLIKIIERHVNDAAANYDAVPRSMTHMVIGEENYLAIKRKIVDGILARVPGGPIHTIEDYADKALDIENTLRERLELLPPDQFSGLLRPIFQEDEWKLLLVGALLGLAVGIGQAFFLL